ncbi:hypothetical protein [Rhodovulum sulfidophilum]|uniref:hypothetical protein n=1 Tax=Rhodovulum sulfidophilum TaxID=35806 RepID=UPI00138A1A7F|nr:hypothetical protein [Rhodovulum sulfidophilum]
MNDGLRRGNALSIRIDPEMDWPAAGTGKRGPLRESHPAYLTSKILFSLTQRILRAARYPRRALWKGWAGTHIRNRIEARINRLKLFCKRIMSRDPDRQTTMIQISIAIMKR